MRLNGVKLNYKTSILAIASVIAVVLGSSSCSKGSSISSTEEGSSSGTASLSTTAVFPTSSGSGWSPITSAGRYYIKGLDLSINGSCTLGVASVKVSDDGGTTFFSETATCAVDGTYAWQKSFASGAQGNKTLTLAAFDISGLQMSGSTLSVQVRIDNTAPAAPVVTDPVSSPYTHTTSATTYDIDGTVAADVVRLTTDGGVTVTPSGVNWTHTVTLVAGASLDFHYYAYDLAGNQSAVTTQTIAWAPDVAPLAYGTFPGGMFTDGGTSYRIEAALDHFPGATDSTSPAGGSAYHINTGFNYVTNSARGL